MADPLDMVPENAPGKWYVDMSCLPCHCCLQVPGAERVLCYTSDQSKVYFFKQPENEEEAAIADQALDVCPQGAIGDDGDE